MNAKVKESLDTIMQAFETGEIADAVAYASIPAPNVPMYKWSLTNRLLCYFAGTTDARGIRQWNEVGRRVNKGSKAFFILAPRIKTVEVEKEHTMPGGTTYKETEKERIHIGFIGVPVFRVEDTNGEPMENPLESIPMPPLAQVAERFGVSIRYAPTNGACAGFYQPNKREITLCTTTEKVFFHELAHAAHHRVNGSLKGGQNPKQEIIADLVACVLARMYGKDYTGNTYRYIRSYAGKKSVYQAAMDVLKETDLVLREIMKYADMDAIEKAVA